MCRYLDSVSNKDSTLPPIPHLHSLLTDDGDPHPEVDIFKLVRSSYEVSLLNMTRAPSFNYSFNLSEMGSIQSIKFKWNSAQPCFLDPSLFTGRTVTLF